MDERRSHDRGFNELAIRVTVWGLVWAGLVVGGLIANIVYAPDTMWPSFVLIGVLLGGGMLRTQVSGRKRRQSDEHPTPICCPKCRFLTATPSGFCPRCGETIPSQRCRKCGYDLRGNTTGACSECGMMWDAPPGTFRCTWPDCLQPNPTGALTCRHGGREITDEQPISQEDRKRVHRFLWFGIFGLLPWPLDFILALLTIAAVVLIGLLLLAGLLY